MLTGEYRYKTKPDWLRRNGLEKDGVTYVPNWDRKEASVVEAL